jgi:short-subunit dehydrogenase
MTKIWIIGASEGIGRAVAEELSKDKNNELILSARNSERLAELSKDLRGERLLVPLDVSAKESVLRGWQVIKKSIGTIDTIIYCAGYYKPMSAEDMEIDEIEKMIDVNLVGAIRILNSVIPEFIKKRSGHIVLIGSIAGYIGLPRSMGYGASKAGLIHLAENLQCDLASHNIKIQVINPGFVKTRLTDLNNFRMPSIMTPEEAATHIIKAIERGGFESRFPFFVANFLKLISKLPYWLYFRLAKRIKNQE